VSIVTPVYNGEEYLDECIQSVRNQTYQNWEYVIIDNCSTDRTPEIAEAHAAEDSRIRVVKTTELLPLIRNHNFALQQISTGSKYCKMVHADDMLLPTCVELMVASAEAHPTAGIVGSYGIWGRKVVSDGIPLSTTFMPGRELSRLTLLNKLYCFWSPSALLIRSDLIRERRSFYNEKYIHADVEACYEILKTSDFGFVHQVLTFIRRHEDSMTSVMADPVKRTILSNLHLLLMYGPIFLTHSEYQTHLGLKTKQYYHFLALSLFQLKGLDFWRYHRDFLEEIGLKLRYSRVILAALAALIDSPIKTCRMVARSAIRMV
jgi:glycosyltransferase involved in cell wall biosynthesis